jgi:hypothetical protein
VAYVACFDCLGFYSLTALNKDDSEAIFGFAADGEVVSECTVGDPLLAVGCSAKTWSRGNGEARP